MHRADSAALMWASDSEGEEVAARPSAPSRASAGPAPPPASAEDNGSRAHVEPTSVPAAPGPVVVRTPSPRRGPALATAVDPAAATDQLGDGGGAAGAVEDSGQDLDRRLRGQWRSRIQLRNQQAETAALYRCIATHCHVILLHCSAV